MATSLQSVPTSALVATGLTGGYLATRATGVRPLGGVVLAVCGGLAAQTWARRHGAGTAAALTAVYLAGFGASHPLAKRIGAAGSVAAVTAAASGAAYLVSDRRA